MKTNLHNQTNQPHCITKLAAGLRALTLAALAVAATPDSGACGVPIPFGESGPFVAGPAFVAGLTVGAPVAMAGCVVGMPFNKAGSCALTGALVGGAAGAVAVGTPLYILKKVTYDAPKALSHHLAEHRHKVAAH